MVLRKWYCRCNEVLIFSILTFKLPNMDSRTIAWVSYITIIGWIIAYVNHNNALVKSSFATFHLRQSFGLMVFYFAIWIVWTMVFFMIPLIGTLLWLLY